MAEASIILVCTSSADEYGAEVQFVTLEVTTKLIFSWLHKIALAKSLQAEDSNFCGMCYWDWQPRWYQHFYETWEQVNHPSLSDTELVNLENLKEACLNDWCQFPSFIDAEGVSNTETELDSVLFSNNSVTFRCYQKHGSDQVESKPLTVDELKGYLITLQKLDEELAVTTTPSRALGKDSRVINVDRPTDT